VPAKRNKKTLIQIIDLPKKEVSFLLHKSIILNHENLT
jgi:hypothetical protein